MKNITVSVDDEVYRKARIRAAEDNTSVSALVKEFLTRIAREESDFDRRKRLQAEVIASIREFRASDRSSRDQIHERNPVS